LEHAVIKAAFLLLEWLVEECGLSQRDAYL
jgi:hypothetical protein